MLEQGQRAPDFELPDQDGRPLSPRRARPCADYTAAGAVVLGVSPDPPARLKRFQEKHALGSPLLTDQDHAVAQAHGVWVEKSMYGRRYFGNERTTFVIDPDGRIVDVLREVKPAEHGELVLR